MNYMKGILIGMEFMMVDVDSLEIEVILVEVDLM